MEKQALKEIAIEQKKSFDAVEKGIRRDLLARIEEYSRLPQIVVLTGIRRCGKSTLLRQSMDFLGNKGYYFNFEDERLLGFDARNFNDLYEVFLELYGEKKMFFFDEIQNVPEWERFIRRMYDGGAKFFITSSNASLLSRELGTRLTGRYVSIDLQPFSFCEYLKFSGYDLRTGDLLETKKRAKIKRYFNAYVKKGGMPEYLKFGNVEALKKVYNDILYRDVVAKFGVEDTKALRELSFYLISNLASPYTYNRLKKFLGLGSFNTVKSYIDHLENSLLFYSVNLYSRSLKQQSVAARKIYAADNGLANAVSFNFSADRGKYLENAVFLELKRRGAEIFYYKTKSNLEVDFFTRGKEKNLFQVSWDLSHEKTKKREFKALLEAMDEQKIKSGLILTDSEEGEEIIEKKKIVVKPVWKWLLEK